MAVFFFLTIGNYSFLKYSISGEGGAPFFLRMLPQLRLIVPLWIIGYAFYFNFKLSLKIIKDNVDVLLLGLSWFLSSLLSLDINSYLLYGTWTLACFLAVVLSVSYTALISRTLSHFSLRILYIIWIGNGVILLLDLVSLLLVRPGGKDIYHVIFSSNTFWAYPTMVMGILALIYARFAARTTRQKMFYLFIFLVALYLIYYSARRSPLFIMVLSVGLLFIPLRLPQMMLIVFFLSFFYIVGSSINFYSVLNSLPNSYTKYRIERMLGLVKGQKETSYNDRQKIWSVYIDSFYENPIMGAGLAAHQRLMDKFPKRLEGYSAHNTFVGLIAETGLLGTLLLVYLLSKSLLQLVQVPSKKWIQIYLILFVPTLFINWFEYNLLPGQIFFFYTIVIWLLPRGIPYLSKPLSALTT